MTNIAVGRGNMGKGAIGHIQVWVMLHHVVYFLSIDINFPYPPIIQMRGIFMNCGAHSNHMSGLILGYMPVSHSD